MSCDIDFRAMPKIELHAHLSGSISRQCLHEIWLERKAAGATDLEDPLVVMPVGKHDYDLNTFFPLFSSYIYHLVSDLPGLVRSTRAVVRDFAADGVAYLELRTTPRAMPAAGLTKAGYVRTVLDALAAAERECPSIRARLILSVDRRNTPAEADEVIALAEEFSAPCCPPAAAAAEGGVGSEKEGEREEGGGEDAPGAGCRVVGVDLCGDPLKGDVSDFTAAFARARRFRGGPGAGAGGRLGVTIHFAEAEASASAAELATILSWAPDRLGHVIHVPEPVKRQIVAAAAARDGAAPPTGLELCLSCNVHAKMISGGFEAHHFGEWWRAEGTVVVPCTDDVGVFGSPVSNEWRLIEEHFKLTREELLGLARKGIDVIFGGEAEKRRLQEIMW